MAKLELCTLLKKYTLIKEIFAELDSKIDDLLEQITGVKQMLAILFIMAFGSLE